MLRIVTLLFCISAIVAARKNGKCNFFERWFKSKQDCAKKYIPDEYLDVPQIIARHGYPSETHVVVTEDGYLLKVHRIPSRNNSQPIFLQHGLLGSSADWIINGNDSLGFLLADSGYDVWLGNARGNVYSKGHISLSAKSAEFWNFSFHEMGTRDLPAVLYHISNTTQKYGEILYIGHSMGTTMFFIFSSLLPEAAKNIKFMAALAPVAYMSHIKSPVKYLAPFTNNIAWITRHLGLNEFLPSNKLLKFLAYDCELLDVDEEICENVIFCLCGFDKEEFNRPILPVVLNKDPAGTSTKTIVHYAQEIRNNGSFQQFDYGSAKNMIKYGTKYPPQYNITNIKRAIYMMYGPNDYLSNYIDIKRLASGISTLVGIYKVQLDSFNHIDFLFGKHAAELVYKPLIKVMFNYTLH